MTSKNYLKEVRKILDHLEQTQLPAVDKASDLVVNSLMNGGAVFVSEVGHGGQGDFLNRAGGLAALHSFNFGLSVASDVAECLKSRPGAAGADEELELVRLAIKRSNMRSGDVLLLSSISGKTARPIDLSLACRELGIKTIGLTSFEYTAKVESLHPSGKKLIDVVDVAIDIGAPYGDAAVDVPGYDVKVIPMSGIAMGAAGWMIWGEVMEKTAKLGKPATVFISINREGGREFYDNAISEYNSRGF